MTIKDNGYAEHWGAHKVYMYSEMHVWKTSAAKV